jgi:hypothetical protein
MSDLTESVMEFMVCIRNDDYQASLEPRKLYRVIPDPLANKHHQVRIVDESGEDYLYPADYFVAVDLPGAVKDALRRAA